LGRLAVALCANDKTVVDNARGAKARAKLPPSTFSFRSLYVPAIFEEKEWRDRLQNGGWWRITSNSQQHKAAPKFCSLHLQSQIQ
jgi:hypothetical protein